MDLSAITSAFGREATLLVDSSPELARRVHKRACKAAETNDAYSYRKRPSPMPYAHCTRTSPAQVLHELGVATTFFTHPPFAEIARHWAQMRYCATLELNRHKQLALSRHADEVVYHHKVAQSEQLGIGLALVVAKEALRRKYDGWEFSAVDAEVALRAGFVEGLGPVRHAGRTKKRPDYFLVGHRTDGGAGFKVVVLECKGTHTSGYETRQLATACVQVQTVEIGGSAPSGLMVASVLSRDGIVSHLLDPDGDDDLWSGTDEEVDELLAETPQDAELSLSSPTATQLANRRRDLGDPRDLELFSVDQPDVAVEEPGGDAAEDLDPGAPQIFQIPSERRRWFFGVLARTAAATALLFAGDGEQADRYATPRQRQSLPPEPDQVGLDDQAGPVSTASSTFTLAGGLDFTGTRYEAPLPGGRVLEIHRGIEQELHGLLTAGQVGRYLRTAAGVHGRWLRRRANPGPGGAVSVGRDGTALLLRIR